jgi:hypothetical protein
MSAPSKVPHSAPETATPRPDGERENISRNECVTPAMTAVSNPNNVPAKLAIIATLTCAEPFMDCPFAAVPPEVVLGIPEVSYYGMSAMSFIELEPPLI